MSSRVILNILFEYANTSVAEYLNPISTSNPSPRQWPCLIWTGVTDFLLLARYVPNVAKRSI